MSLQEKSLENLLVSKVRVKSLEFFLLNPNTSIHLRGAVREFKEEINAVRRELLRLEAMKLVTIENKGNRKYFRLNLEHPFISELFSIIHKSYGLGAEIMSNSRKLGEVQYAVLTESYTRGIYRSDQKIDLVIIGTVDMSVLEKIIQETERKTGKEIHYSVLKLSEFEIRKRRKDEFLMDLMLQELVLLIGDHKDFARF